LGGWYEGEGGKRRCRRVDMKGITREVMGEERGDGDGGSRVEGDRGRVYN